jgi:hypothetical protein
MKLISTLVASCVVAIGLGTPAHAGVTVTFESAKDRSVLYIEGNKMRVEGAGGTHHDGIMIFDGDQQKMTVIDPDKKTYTEMTPQTLRAMQAQGQRQLQESMAKLTPEQRKQMEQMMSKMSPEQRKAMEGMMSGRTDSKTKDADDKTKNADIKWERTGNKKTVAGYPCEGFKELKDGKQDAEGCYIPWSAGAITKADLAPLHKMEEFLAQSGTNLPHGRFSMFAQMEQGPGFPGEWVQTSNGDGSKEKQALTSVKRGSLPADNFQLPAGLTKSDMGVGH